MADELVTIPENLDLVGDEELAALEVQFVSEFDRVNPPDGELTPDDLDYSSRLADDIDTIRAQKAAREAKARKAVEQAMAKNVEHQANLMSRVHGARTASPGEAPPIGGGGVDYEALAAAAARGSVAGLAAILGERGTGQNLVQVTERASRSLAEASRHAPAAGPPRQPLAVTAGVDIPGLARGAELTSLDALVDAFHRRSRGLPTTTMGYGTPEHLVASVSREYSNTIDDRTKPSQVEELIKHLTSAEKQAALVAGGGWCAPSEPLYDFFNIACEDGAVDLPTFGVSRGGITHPVSPSLASATLAPFGDVFADDSVPWLWTESSDESSIEIGGPTKPCIRVPCATTTERRLECYGICVTAGNLTDSAWPEATANFIQLVMSAHFHAMNAQIIATMASLSTAAITAGIYGASTPAYNALVSGIDFAATDYRARYGMCEEDVLEVVIPYWVITAVRADLALRTGTEQLVSVTKSRIVSYLADRNIRPQFVGDWQVRGAGQFGFTTPISAWPTTVTFMIYAAGTFVLGNGLVLDLGVVRDSTLNETNDHTAAWSEECHLVARVGHESRRYTITLGIIGDHCCT